MIIKYMTADGKYFDNDTGLIKVITGDSASFYLTQDKFDEVKAKSLNTSEVKE